jgi:hypothetical protein
MTYTTFTGATTGAHSLAGNTIPVNTPQLGISIVYVFYNSMLTRMFVTYEFSNFAFPARHSLRVSRPVGSQRSIYWLQLPYRYILPIMAGMALLHWLISRGLYLTNTRVYNIRGQEEPGRNRFTYSMSGLGLLFAFLVGTAMLLLLAVLMFRRLGTGMPILGTCIVAISAACHPAHGDEDAATKILSYGVVPSQPGDIDGSRRHVCFSSKDVESLQDGVAYYWLKRTEIKLE